MSRFMLAGPQVWRGNDPSWQWQPRWTTHDPNPPITLETGAAVYAVGLAAVVITTSGVGRIRVAGSGLASIAVTPAVAGHVILDRGVATFLSYTPVARFDGLPWTQVRVQESIARTGLWAEIEVFTLTPVDTDPANPQPRSFTTKNVTVGSGWLRLVWEDADNRSDIGNPEFVGLAIRPAVLDVANLMPDRTTLAGGMEAGTFNTLTRPTGTQVDGIIDMVLDTVDPKVAQDASTETQRSARAIVTLTAAILTEVTYFSHQGDVSEQRIAAWQRLIDQHELTLETAAAATVDGVNTLQVGTVRWSNTSPSVYDIVSLDITS